jgi:NADH-quinone oxidoreductase subunit F
MSQPDLTFVDIAVERIGREPHAVIPLLQAIQKHYGYLPQEALERVCELTDIRPATIVGVSSFYTQFRDRPIGRHIIRVCHGTACHVKGADRIYEAVRRNLSISNDEDTDTQRRFTVQKVACLGCCTLAPAMQIDQVTYGYLTPNRVPQVLRDFLELQKRTPHETGRKVQIDRCTNNYTEIRIGLGSCCVARGSGRILDALEEALAETRAPALVKPVGCVGMCHRTPLVEIVAPDRPSALYANVLPEDIKPILLRHVKPAGLTRRIRQTVSHALESLLTDGAWKPVTRYSIDVRDLPVASFLGRQKHLATEHCGSLGPLDLDDYLAHDGFKALQTCVKDSTPEIIIDQIKQSGLRGRGGAGYPTGLKWSQVRQARGDTKYVICNGDEGDPGAFMDRMLLESYPYRLIEGLAIAARAVGADEGYFYIRAEYPLAVRRISEAIRRCEERGLLGDLRIHIMEGAGAFVCGEETALIASLEGRRGTPRLRPPYPATSGLWGKPTLVNNAETYALVPWIIRNGAGAFAALGTEKSTGTKVFALAGRINRAGLIEVPMGITLREIVEDIGGGIAGGRQFKAVQIGGPSGACLPASLAHTPVDYDSLAAAGTIMGSGGLVVLDETDCMVDIARYFLQFTQNQSCGKCTFCRIGTRRMLDILTRICNGEGKRDDLDQLESLAAVVKKASICGLGRTAPNPVLSTLRHFRDEYEAHLEKRCPAGRCKALIKYSVTDDCIGCTICAQNCPVDAIAITPYRKHEIDSEKCTRCDVCRQVCPREAIKVE